MGRLNYLFGYPIQSQTDPASEVRTGCDLRVHNSTLHKWTINIVGNWHFPLLLLLLLDKDNQQKIVEAKRGDRRLTAWCWWMMGALAWHHNKEGRIAHLQTCTLDFGWTLCELLWGEMVNFVGCFGHFFYMYSVCAISVSSGGWVSLL
jgi:hypothetical protein